MDLQVIPIWVVPKIRGTFLRVRHPWADPGAVAEFVTAVLGGQWAHGAVNGSECHR